MAALICGILKDFHTNTMKESDLEKVEAILTTPVPPALKELLLTKLDNYPDFGLKPFSHEEMISTFSQYLDKGLNDKAWLEHLLPIGLDENQEFVFFLDLRDSKPWVYSAGFAKQPEYDPSTYQKDCKFGLII